MEFFKMALSAITRNKVRASLTMLGIIVGVGAVIAMIGIGEGSRRASIALIQNMGSNMLTIFPGSPGTHSHHGPQAMGSAAILKDDDAQLIHEELADSSIHAATPQVSTTRPVVYQSRSYISQIQGTGPEFLQIRGWELEQGRFFTEREVRGLAKVCVIGKTVQANLFPDGEDPVDLTIRIGDLPFRIVGVLERKGAGMWGDQDDLLVSPYTTVMRKVMGRDTIQRILVSAHEGEAALAETEIISLLRQHLKVATQDPEPFQIRKQDDVMKMQSEQAGILTALLAVAASISLVVGGIGISNIMLVSVTERTREIGIRKALGARRRNILMQFLIEAMVLCLVGGVIGLALGLSLGSLLSQLLLKHLGSVPTWAIGAAFLVPAIVGLTFGLYPAAKASKLDPIEALRYE